MGWTFMRRAPIVIFVLTAFLVIFSTSVWGVLQCGENLAGGTTILKLSAQTNAHGEIYSQSNYLGEDIRCLETTGVSVGPQINSNKVTPLRLSGITNAHAARSDPLYLTPVEIGHNGSGQILTVVADASAASNNSCDDFDTASATFVELVRLSRLTNAHLQVPNYAGTKYDYIICVAYDSSASMPQDDIIQTSIIGTPLNVVIGQTMAANIITTNVVAGDSDYDTIKTFNVTAICQVGNGNCDSITDYYDFENELTDMLTPPYSGAIIPASLSIVQFGTGDAVQNFMVNGIIGAYNPPYTLKGDLDSITTALNPSSNDPYTIDTAVLGLGVGQYRILSFNYEGSFNYKGAPFPENDVQTTNFSSTIFDITTACGTGFEQCTAPGTQAECNAGETCNTFCVCITGGGGNIGTPGDVYVLKNIVFPNVYQNNDVTAELTIENKNVGLTGNSPTVNLTINIRDSAGKLVTGFDPAIFNRVLNFASGSTSVQSIIIQNTCSGVLCPFKAGETYTLYATIPKYINANPALSETLTSNNSGYKTFTTLPAPQTYSVPDSPWWMSGVMVLVVVGWLFVSTRKKEQ